MDTRVWKPLSDADCPVLPPEVRVADSHCHLDMGDLGADLEPVFRRAERAGVCWMVNIGGGGPLELNEAAVELAGRRPDVVAAVGVHPHDAASVDERMLEFIRRLASRDRVVAIGETGLDYYYDHSPRERQREAFRLFVRLAREVRLPVVVHLRDADEDALAILREEKAAEIGGVIHCFSSGPDSARRFLDLGFHLSFSGIVSFKAADAVRDSARLTPLDRLLIETDAPFLAPAPYRGRRNEPALVARVAQVLAEVRGEALDRLAAATLANTRRLFAPPDR